MGDHPRQADRPSRGRKLNISFIIQVDTLCHKLPNFIEKSKRAGVKRVFIGLENINPDSLLGAKKRQNKITDYRQMLLAWKHVGIVTYCGYILGFPGDTQESILHDIEIIKRELPVDLLEFFYLTPLPGSEDHKTLHEAGVAMDEDLNKYDLNHDVTGHPIMSRDEWRETYRKAWETYYTDEHVETVLCRVRSRREPVPARRCSLSSGSRAAIGIEGIHPLEGGLPATEVAAKPSFRDETRESARLLSKISRSNAVETASVDIALHPNAPDLSRVRKDPAI